MNAAECASGGEAAGGGAGQRHQESSRRAAFVSRAFAGHDRLAPRRRRASGKRTPGHANVGITFDIDSLVAPHMQSEATEKIDARLRKALEG